MHFVERSIPNGHPSIVTVVMLSWFFLEQYNDCLLRFCQAEEMFEGRQKNDGEF